MINHERLGAATGFVPPLGRLDSHLAVSLHPANIFMLQVT